MRVAKPGEGVLGDGAGGGAGGQAQELLAELGGALHGLPQGGEGLLAGAGLGGGGLGQGQPKQAVHLDFGLGEGEAAQLHEEVVGRPVGTAPEAVEVLAVGGDGQGGVLIGVEGAEVLVGAVGSEAEGL